MTYSYITELNLQSDIDSVGVAYAHNVLPASLEVIILSPLCKTYNVLQANVAEHSITIIFVFLRSLSVIIFTILLFYTVNIRKIIMLCA